jgi:prepilin-type processing-associated H-X9-DG protein
MAVNVEKKRSGSFAEALLWTIFLSIAFCPFFFIGPFLAGLLGGRKANKNVFTALLAGLGPALIWALAFVLASHMEVKGVTLGTLVFFALPTALAILGGEITGSGSIGWKFAGIILFLAGVCTLLPRVEDVQNVLQIMRPVKTAQSKPGALTCPQTLHKLYDAMMNYAQAWDDTLPPADRWGTALTDSSEQFITPDKLNCPGARQFGYAMNSAIGGKRLEQIHDKAVTPLLFDSMNLSENAHDNTSSIPLTGRHEGKNYILYMDGHVAAR